METIEKIVNESGLVLSDAEEIKQSYLPYFALIAEIKEQANKINFENPTDLDERIARELRLKTVKVRTGSQEVKDNRKRIYTLRANVEQSSWNLIKDTCLIDEERFAQVEKAAERKEKARKEALKQERITILAPLDFQYNEGFHLDEMDEDAFQVLLSGVTKAYNDRKEAEAKAELDRIAKEKAEAEERERMRIENERLKAEREAAEKAQAIERKEAEQKLQAEKAKAAAAQREAEKEKAKQEAKLKAEREAKEKAERELANAKAAEAKRVKDEADRIEAENKAKIAEEKRAAKAPDKDKLLKWIDDITLPVLSLSESESKATAKEITERFASFKTWAKNQITSL